MSIQTVKSFLRDERRAFLDYGADIAAVEASRPKNSALAKDMYAHWVEYYDELIAQNKAMRRRKGPKLKAILTKESEVLATAITALKANLPADTTPAKWSALVTLIELMQIEKDATDRMKTEIGP